MKVEKPIIHGRDHACGGADPIPGICDVLGRGGDSVLDILLSKSPVGLWKLDEDDGDTAFDSSGAGNHMTVPNGGAAYVAPTWGQAAGPPGTQSALFAIGTGIDEGSRLSVTMPSGLTDNFSAGLWVYVNDDGLGPELMGQGVPIHASGGGWTIFYNVSTDKFSVCIGATGYPIITSNNTSAEGAWYLYGFSRISGTWTQYLQGLAQSDTSTAEPLAAQTATWIGDDGFSSGNHGSNQTMSWAFILDDPLSGSEWLELYEAGISGGVLGAGLVWTTDGFGGASWQPVDGGSP